MKDAAPCLEVEDISFSLSQLNQLQPYQLALAQFNFDYDPETMTKRILSLWNQKRETRRSAIQNGKANETSNETDPWNDFVLLEFVKPPKDLSDLTTPQLATLRFNPFWRPYSGTLQLEVEREFFDRREIAFARQGYVHKPRKVVVSLPQPNPISVSDWLDMDDDDPPPPDLSNATIAISRPSPAPSLQIKGISKLELDRERRNEERRNQESVEGSKQSRTRERSASVERTRKRTMHDERVKDDGYAGRNKVAKASKPSVLPKLTYYAVDHDYSSTTPRLSSSVRDAKPHSRSKSNSSSFSSSSATTVRSNSPSAVLPDEILSRCHILFINYILESATKEEIIAALESKFKQPVVALRLSALISHSMKSQQTIRFVFAAYATQFAAQVVIQQGNNSIMDDERLSIQSSDKKVRWQMGDLNERYQEQVLKGELDAIRFKFD